MKVARRTVAEKKIAYQLLLQGLAYIDLRLRWAVTRAREQGFHPEDEFRGLYISEAELNQLLAYDVGQHIWNGRSAAANGHHQAALDWETALQTTQAAWQDALQADQVSPLGRLVAEFGLTSVEVDILLIALASEIEPRYERLFAYLQDDVTKKRPSVDLILNVLTTSFAEKLAYRRFFAQQAPLFAQRLLQLFRDPSHAEPTQLAHYVAPDEGLVSFLLGESGGWAVAGSQIIQGSSQQPLMDHQVALVAQLTAVVAREERPIFSFVGGHGLGKQAVARQLAAVKEQALCIVDLAVLEQAAADFGSAIQLLLRNGRLHHAILYFDQWTAKHQPLLEKLSAYPHTVIVAAEKLWHPQQTTGNRPFFSVPFAMPSYQQRLQLWQMVVPQTLDPQIVASQFRLTSQQIYAACATAQAAAMWRDEAMTVADLQVASRLHSNQKLSELATKIEPRYEWRNIVLPSDTFEQLREMVNMVKQRPFVYNTWGFGQKLALGRGVNALFAGESGTGKTMAADIIANDLGLDLYKIDLSMLVSKYIGETEKNLDRIFTEATTSNAILFFDEADAIFGKRSEVKDSHDRYANIEISYLLQRMEAYDGVVILATNLRANLDDAFTRRLHFAIEFPFPEVADRERIWRVNVPASTPLATNVDFALLAKRFRLAGGNIRNIILVAAFLAAEEKKPLQMSHFLHATRREYQKMGRLLNESLFTEESDES